MIFWFRRWPPSADVGGGGTMLSSSADSVFTGNTDCTLKQVLTCLICVLYSSLRSFSLCRPFAYLSLFFSDSICWSKANPGSPLGQPRVPDFWRATMGPRRKLGYGGSR